MKLSKGRPPAHVVEYVRKQDEWVAANLPQTGSPVYVLVLRRAERHEDGWDNEWYDPGMDPRVGRLGKIDTSHLYSLSDRTTPNEWVRAKGIYLLDGYRYPYFVLQVINFA